MGGGTSTGGGHAGGRSANKDRVFRALSVQNQPIQKSIRKIKSKLPPILKSRNLTTVTVALQEAKRFAFASRGQAFHFKRSGVSLQESKGFASRVQAFHFNRPRVSNQEAKGFMSRGQGFHVKRSTKSFTSKVQGLRFKGSGVSLQ